LKKSLEQTLSWQGRNFFIPVDCEIGYRMKPMMKVNLNNSISDITSELSNNWEHLNERRKLDR